MWAGNTHSGVQEDPEDDVLGSRDPSRGLRNSNVTFQNFQNFGAGDFILQLGDLVPNPNPKRKGATHGCIG